MTIEEQIQLRTQEILKMQIGDLVLTAARKRAEVDALSAELAALREKEPPRDPA